ncbi:GTPase Era [Ferrimicrobium sp.]|uniref:GTPase Era n=1 Tax=Ferrimicrobium sp. TaxID=2926050 RepID=UPI00262D0B09|nr:GTPase Era [Ferrimicrobium sp.]
MQSGFVAIVGRTNVGKSSLINSIAEARLSTVSWHKNTTRRAVRVIVREPDVEMVLVDTPGLDVGHDQLAARLFAITEGEMDGADLTLMVLDATKSLSERERVVLERLSPEDLVVVNKIDLVPPGALLPKLQELSGWKLSDYLLASAKRGDGVVELRQALSRRLPEGAPMYDADTKVDLPLRIWLGEVVRDELLNGLRDEVPHSVECRVVDWDDDEEEVPVTIFVERDSQKGILIGEGGARLRSVRRRVNRRLRGRYRVRLEVKVAKEWSHDSRRLDEFEF